MGNRAIITTAPYDENNVGIYVHWNGGQESIRGFLAAAKELGYRSPGSDPEYSLARLTQAIGVFFGGSDSVGLGLCKHLDDSDNGTWLIGGDWEIVGRVKGKLRSLDAEQRLKAADIAATIVAKTKTAEGFELKPRVELPEEL